MAVHPVETSADFADLDIEVPAAWHMWMIVVGETASELMRKHPHLLKEGFGGQETKLDRMRKFRSTLAHHYSDRDDEIMLDLARDVLPRVKSGLAKICRRLDNEVIQQRPGGSP